MLAVIEVLQKAIEQRLLRQLLVTVSVDANSLGLFYILQLVCRSQY